MKRLAITSLSAAALLSATPALAASCGSTSVNILGTDVGNVVCQATGGILNLSPTGSTPSGGAPAPLLASGIPSLIALGIAAAALRRRSAHEDAAEDAES